MKDVRMMIVGLVLITLALVGAGCGSHGPSWQQRQREMVKTVAGVCRDHGGLGYVNFDNHEALDEAACGDGTRLRDGKAE